MDGGDRAAVSDVAGYDPGVIDIQSDHLGALLGHKLVARSVGSVTADVILLVIFVRETVHIGLRRHGLMEGGVKCDDLRDVGKNFLASPDTKQMGGIVKRSEIAAEIDLRQDVLVHNGAS